MTESSQRLAGRRILITGGAAGIGRATAQLFAGEGAEVALLDRDAVGVAETAARIGCFSSACDVTVPDDVASAVAEAEKALGGLDGAINAAGLLKMGRFEDASLDDWTGVLDVNLKGTMLVCKAIIPAFRRAGRGTIVNIASIAALQPPPGSSAYAVSKAGVLMLSRCLAKELGPDIRVNAVCPGTIETAMTASLRQDNAVNERLANAAAAKRIGTPTEVGQAMLFLTSDESAFVSGAALTVDGGTAFH